MRRSDEVTLVWLGLSFVGVCAGKDLILFIYSFFIFIN